MAETANRPLNRQAITIEEAETELRIVVKDGYLTGKTADFIRIDAAKVIKRCVDALTLPVLKDAARRSLWSFFNRQLSTIRAYLPPHRLMLLWALVRIRDGKDALVPPTFTEERAEAYLSSRGDMSDTGGNFIGTGRDLVSNKGNAMKMFTESYMKEHVRPVFNRLAELRARDPDDVTSNNTLRNRAEMEVRYNDHLEQIEKLRQEGHRLVIASTHADCSRRCRDYQGRVYSLDGTYGVTDDGRRFVPLEEATDVYYTTKAGKTYKNGLLGFNCRHYLVPYKSGYRFPRTSEAYERRQYAITQRQRALERNVRFWRTKAVEFKGNDKEAYQDARKKAVEWNNRYIAYSQRNDRAYYPSRTKIL